MRNPILQLIGEIPHQPAVAIASLDTEQILAREAVRNLH